MTKDNDNAANSIEAEPTVPASDDWREHARRGQDMLQEAITRIAMSRRRTTQARR